MSCNVRLNRRAGFAQFTEVNNVVRCLIPSVHWDSSVAISGLIDGVFNNSAMFVTFRLLVQGDPIGVPQHRWRADIGRRANETHRVANATTHDARRDAREVERRRDENERLRQEIAEQKKRIADLERQMALCQQNSTTTSKPPASDGLAGRQRQRGRRRTELCVPSIAVGLLSNVLIDMPPNQVDKAHWVNEAERIGVIIIWR